MPSGPLRLKSQRGRFAPIGLATNPLGLSFQCGTCEYYGKDVAPDQCGHEDKRLHGQQVDAVRECCNRYDNPQMKVRIQ